MLVIVESVLRWRTQREHSSCQTLHGFSLRYAQRASFVNDKQILMNCSLFIFNRMRIDSVLWHIYMDFFALLV